MCVNGRVKRLLAVLLAVALLLPTLTVCLPAEASAADWGVQTFEAFATGSHTASAGPTGIGGNGEGREVSEDHNHTAGGAKSIKMKMAGYKDFKSTAQTVAMGADGTRVLLTKGTTYTVSVWLYSETAVSVKFRLASVKAPQNVTWDERQNETETVVDLSADQWKSVTVNITPIGLASQDTAYLTLGVAYADAAATETAYVYLDDVKVEEKAPVVVGDKQDFENIANGKEIGLKTAANAVVSAEQDHTGTAAAGQSLKVAMTTSAGVGREQFALLAPDGTPVTAENGKKYAISMYVYIPETAAATVRLNYWVCSSPAAAALSNKSAAEYDLGTAYMNTPTNQWVEVAFTMDKAVANGPYLIFGITTTDAHDHNRTVYIDDLQVTAATADNAFTSGLQDYESYEAEIYDATGDGIHGNGSGREVSAEQNHTAGGTKSVKLNVNNENIGYYARTVLPLDGADFAVKRGESYTVSFWLYSEEEREITWYVGSVVSGTNMYAGKNDGEKQGTVTLPAGQWTQVTAHLSGIMGYHTSNTAYLTVGALFAGCEAQPAPLYLDDVEIKVPEHPVTVTFHAEGGGQVESRTAIAGETLGYLPTSAREGYLFDGWYSADGTVLYTADTVLPAQGTALDVYAQWTAVPADAPSLTTGFEAAEYTTAPYLNDGSAADAARGNMTASAAWLKDAGFDAETGDGSMRLVNTPFVYETDTAYQAFALMNPDGSRFVVKAGTKYRISYSYRGAVIGSAHSYVTAVLTSDTAFTGVGVGDQVLQKNDIHGAETDWSRSEETFVARKDGYVYLTLSARSTTSQSSSEGHVALIDNVSVEVLDDTYTVVTFVNGGSTFATRVGKEGTPIAYPAVTVEAGKELEGFFTDAELTDKFEPAVYPTEDTTLYARFTDGVYDGAASQQETVSLTFEEEMLPAWYAASNHMSHVYGEIDYITDDAANAHGGDSYIRFNALEWHYQPAVLMLYDPAMPHSILYLEPNTAYKIRMWVNSPDDFQPVSIGLYFNAPGGMNTESVSAGAASMSLADLVADEWILVEKTVTTGDERVALSLRVGSAAQAFRLDDISVQKLRPVTVRFETNGGEPIADLQASTGATIEQPTDPYRNGYEFRGWYTDKELSNKFDFESEIAGDMTLYAKWRPWESGTEPEKEEEKPDISVKPDADVAPAPIQPPAQKPEEEPMDTGNQLVFDPADAVPEAPTVDTEQPTPEGTFSVQMLLIIIAIVVVLVGGGALTVLLRKRKQTNKEEG